MPAQRFDPARLDVAEFARAQAQLEGRLPLAALARLADAVVQPADGAGADVHWSAQGLWREAAGTAPETRLRVRAQATVWLTCQRCLQPAALPIEVDTTLRFVADEALAERLDEEQDAEDVLALPRSLKLAELIEDELILALPIVPRHEACPEPLAYAAEAAADFAPDDTAPDDDQPHPFAALAALKKPTGGA